jgi:hypothetical protein
VVAGFRDTNDINEVDIVLNREGLAFLFSFVVMKSVNRFRPSREWLFRVFKIGVGHRRRK